MSAFSLPITPISADKLLDGVEITRKSIGSPIRLGCPIIDRGVLNGGIPRGRVFHISSEDENLGLKMALQMTATYLTGTTETATIICTQAVGVVARGLKIVAGDQWRDILGRVEIIRVFDGEGLWEVLEEVGGQMAPEEKEEEEKEEEKEKEKEAEGGQAMTLKKGEEKGNKEDEMPEEEVGVLTQDVGVEYKVVKVIDWGDPMTSLGSGLSFGPPIVTSITFSTPPITAPSLDEPSLKMPSVLSDHPSSLRAHSSSPPEPSVRSPSQPPSSIPQSAPTPIPMSDPKPLPTTRGLAEIPDSDEDNDEDGDFPLSLPLPLSLPPLLGDPPAAPSSPLSDVSMLSNPTASLIPTEHEQEPNQLEQLATTIKTTNNNSSSSSLSSPLSSVLSSPSQPPSSPLPSPPPPPPPPPQTSSSQHVSCSQSCCLNLRGGGDDDDDDDDEPVVSRESFSTSGSETVLVPTLVMEELPLPLMMERIKRVEKGAVSLGQIDGTEETSKEGQHKHVPLNSLQTTAPIPAPAQEPPVNKTSPPPPPTIPSRKPPSIILITHFTTLLTSLLTTLGPTAHPYITLLTRHLRHLSRTSPSLPLLLLTNGTTSSSSPSNPYLHLHPNHLLTPQSINNGRKSSFAAARKGLVAFAEVMGQLGDGGVLCCGVPRDACEVGRGVAGRKGWVVEAVGGDGEGGGGWGVVEEKKGRLVDG